MVELSISWDGIEDRTGYLFSFAKALAVSVKNSPYSELAEDVIATSGFAFRMWIDAKEACPSATSIWGFDSQKPWVENGGLKCDYVGRYWEQDDIEEEQRTKAIGRIKSSIERGIPAVSWDIDLPEWGLVIGYDDEKKEFITLSIKGEKNRMGYDLLGKREIPILSVLTVTGKAQKTEQEIFRDTLKLASAHLKGSEWCPNAQGLEAYRALIAFFEENFHQDRSWSMEYYLGTYGGLKLYAYKYFEKMKLSELANLYKRVYDNWQKAFDIKCSEDFSDSDVRKRVVELLKKAYDCEVRAVEIMEDMIGVYGI